MAELRASIEIKARDRFTGPVGKMKVAAGDLRAALDKVDRKRAGGPSPFAKMRKDVVSLRQPIGQLGRNLAGLASTAFNVGKWFGGAGAVALGWFTKSAIDTTAGLEQMKVALETLEGSSAKAEQSMDWIVKFSDKTPYELGEVGDAFTKLRAYGIEPTDGTLRTLGDTASAMGKPLMQSVEAFADALTGENERLKEFGIKARTEGDRIVYSYVQNGQTMERSAKKTSGTAIAATLSAIWNDRYAGAMSKQSKTWNGLMSTLSSKWTLFQNRVMQTGIFDRLKDQLDGLIQSVDRWAEDGTLDRWATKIGDAYTYAFDRIGAGFKWLRQNWPAIQENLKAAWQGVSAFTSRAIDATREVVKLVGGVENFAKILGGLAAAKFLAPLGQIAWTTGKIAGNLAGLAVPKAAIAGVGQLSTSLAGLASPVSIAIGTGAAVVALDALFGRYFTRSGDGSWLVEAGVSLSKLGTEEGVKDKLTEEQINRRINARRAARGEAPMSSGFFQGMSDMFEAGFGDPEAVADRRIARRVERNRAIASLRGQAPQASAAAPIAAAPSEPDTSWLGTPVDSGIAREQLEETRRATRENTREQRATRRAIERQNRGQRDRDMPLGPSYSGMF